MDKFDLVNSYEEAVDLIRKVGILPLADLIPNHPSLCSITKSSDWHTGTSMDPWSWRVRFAGDGSAAYGKFIKKKSILIACDIAPMVKAVIGDQRSPKERYSNGLLSGAALKLYQLIEAEPGIDTRALRARSSLKATEHKKEYDQAITDLQASMDIVISGVHQRFNETGESNGWNSTAFETSIDWMTNNNVSTKAIKTTDAKEQLQEWLKSNCSSEAVKYLIKVFSL